MIRFAIALAVVFALVLGGLLALRRNSGVGRPPQDVIDRAKTREREIEAKERDSDH